MTHHALLAELLQTMSPAAAMAKLRAMSLTPERRKEIASKAAKARWAKKGKKKH